MNVLEDFFTDFEHRLVSGYVAHGKPPSLQGVINRR